jgi:hypothetical protein
MTSFLQALPLMAALVAAPAFAQPADSHAGRHPADAAPTAAAKPGAKTDDQMGCPMMKGGTQMQGGAMKGAAPGQMAMGAHGPMTAEQMQRCRMMHDHKAAPGKATPSAPRPPEPGQP